MKAKMIGKRYWMIPILLFTVCLIAMPVRTMAAENTTVASGTVREKQTGWKTKKSCIYYYDAKGKKVTGLKKISGKYYYFDKKGIQRTGWQKIKGNYYFFKIENGKKGYMVKSKKVNGITLKKDGKAKLTTSAKSKLNVMIKANKIVEKATKPTMSKSQKLRKCFDYSTTKFKYRGSPTFHKTKHWEQNYALDMFDDGHGSCYAYGAAFAFLANAVGYQDVYVVSSGGHGWAEVKGKVYDPSWEITDKSHSYYGVDYKLSGVDGRPNYKKARTYVVKL